MRDDPSFDVTVTRDPDDGTWIAICDAIPIATEAASYDALLRRVWLIAPEIAVMNGLCANEGDVRLRFEIGEQSPKVMVS